MSQIGIETNVESAFNNISLLNSDGREVGDDLLDPFTDDTSIVRQVTVLLIFSVTGLLGNFLTILLVIITRQLRKPHNSFFVHHCILDTIKSAYCLAFSKVSIGCVLIY